LPVKSTQIIPKPPGDFIVEYDLEGAILVEEYWKKANTELARITTQVGNDLNERNSL